MTPRTVRQRSTMSLSYFLKVDAGSSRITALQQAQHQLLQRCMLTAVFQRRQAVVCGELCPSVALSGDAPRLHSTSRALARAHTPGFSQFDSARTTFRDHVMFARRDALDAIGRMPQLPLFEDVALRKRLRSVGQFIKHRTALKTSARRYQTHSVLKTQLINRLLLAAFLLGCPASWLYRLYYGKAAADNGPLNN